MLATSSGQHASESVDGMYRNHNVGRGGINANQQQAVDWGGGPLLVLAGPGSRKTEVVTLRIVRLLEEDEHASALALTATNKAAAEMRNRVERCLGQHIERGLLSTFHAFAVDIFGQHGSHLGIRPEFQLLTQDEDRIAILEEVIRELPGGDDELPQDRTNLLHLIDSLFSDFYRSDGPSSSLTSTPKWFPPLFCRYCDALVGANRRPAGQHASLRAWTRRPSASEQGEPSQTGCSRSNGALHQETGVQGRLGGPLGNGSASLWKALCAAVDRKTRDDATISDRSILYVAMTPARHTLTLLRPRRTSEFPSRVLYGPVR